jgi:hypothetical protein
MAYGILGKLKIRRGQPRGNPTPPPGTNKTNSLSGFGPPERRGQNRLVAVLELLVLRARRRELPLRLPGMGVIRCAFGYRKWVLSGVMPGRTLAGSDHPAAELCAISRVDVPDRRRRSLVIKASKTSLGRFSNRAHRTADPDTRGTTRCC